MRFPVACQAISAQSGAQKTGERGFVTLACRLYNPRFSCVDTDPMKKRLANKIRIRTGAVS